MISEGGVYFVCVGGVVFDLTAGFLLCFPRGIVFYATVFNCVFFHLSNKFLMNIGIFPWVMLASTTLFFEPDWIFNLPGVAQIISPAKEVPFTGQFGWKRKLILLLFFLFALNQILTPLRHHTYYDNVAWNEMGHRYSWRMKLRDKQCDIAMTAVDPQLGKAFNVDFESYLFGKQVRKIKPRPELVIQFANMIANDYQKRSGTRPEVYVDVSHFLCSELDVWILTRGSQLICNLNYRGKQRMFREDVNLADVDPYDWTLFDQIIYPLAPLKNHLQDDLIYNWNKLYSVLTDPLQTYTNISL